MFLETMVFDVDIYTGDVDWTGVMRHVSIPPKELDITDIEVLKFCQELEFLTAKEALPYRRNAGLAKCCERVFQALESVHA